ncbi:hypothetical protein [Pedobacter nutrimenti]|uniref:Uncharacterized protein n=1 Tax=Pedobacter nutrimenti TaxID=1241337 RepID=A0A318UEU8_9SPHI|nr:hypothetical protein [Pedobacter nutrimenti]PYF74876.1 hypothetical protein B0O44_103322 [Pedobacter nutrimenti]
MKIKNKYLIILSGILLGIIHLSWSSSVKKNETDKSQDFDLKISAAKNYCVFNENGKALDALLFINNKMFSGKRTKELIVYFKMGSEPIVLIIALPPKLIGIPELYNTMRLDKDTLFLQKASLKFTVVNVGIEKMIDKWSIEDGTIRFSTFERLNALGKEIIIKKIK